MKTKPDEAKVQMWAERIAAFQCSGLSRRAWCTQNGVNKNTLDSWRKRLSAPAVSTDREMPVGSGDTVAAAMSTVAPIIVTVQPAGDASAVPALIDLPHGVRIRAEAGTDAAWLATLIRGIAGC